MGKGGELWDDSALVDAFDRAVATFKAMHGKNTQATPCENEKPEHASAAAEEEETDEHREKDDNYNKIPCGAMETLQEPSEESKTIEQAPPLQETDPGIEIHASEFKTLSSDATDADRNVSSSQQGEHTELLRRYYELEEQSRNVLQQLQQTNYWNYKEPEYASMYQQQQAPAYNGTAPDPHSCTAQSSCCYWNVPLVSVSCCSAGQPSGSSDSVPPNGGCSVSLTCDQCPGASTTYTTGANFMQPPTTVSTNDDQVTKVAMMTTEGAFNFMRSTISGDPASQRKETETGKESTSMGMWPNFDTTGADSDLAVVLNAWYAAGFYTGRYLMQESVKNSRQ
ncbi:uncharacterized protein LOC133919576 isoform X1 [Phragmites australis]|uniref:uncharacterized protein LOC133919576 isoform X1 n=1 Tax=Phragmites australis TaxID=29695 RepID=UPI002D767CD9|nr:uncharacterized protein LOC133919576 isoform X1 [Phragmites australis]